MRWDVISADADKLKLARELVGVTARSGWSERSLREASRSATGDAERWRRFFPRGSRDAIWFISEISDASMKAAFEATPAPNMAAVIAERFAQNSDLKPFVRRVMVFDLLHPFQALARMQRTARAMVECLPAERRAVSAAAIGALNVAYTLIVCVWLFDTSNDQRATRRATALFMRMLNL